MPGLCISKAWFMYIFKKHKKTLERLCHPRVYIMTNVSYLLKAEIRMLHLQLGLHVPMLHFRRPGSQEVFLHLRQTETLIHA
jgi:hypothetical protein